MPLIYGDRQHVTVDVSGFEIFIHHTFMVLVPNVLAPNVVYNNVTIFLCSLFRGIQGKHQGLFKQPPQVFN